MQVYRLLFTSILCLFILFSYGEQSIDSSVVFSGTDTSKASAPDTSASALKKNFRVDSTGWVDVSNKLIVGCETATNMSWFSYEGIDENLDTALLNANYGIAVWMFKSGYSPLTNSYYLSSRFGKITVFSHSVLSESKLSGNSTTRFVSYGYSRLFRNINVSLSYKNIIGYDRSCAVMNVSDEKKELRVKDYRLSLELIGKGSLKYKKYGFSDMYFPVKISGSANLLLETSYFTIYDPVDIIPEMIWQGDYILMPGTYMKRFSMFTQSLSLHLAEVMPIFKRKGEKPKSFFLKLDYIYGLNFYRYYIYTYPQNKFKSDFRMVFMANSIGSLRLCYADRNWFTSAGVYFRIIKYNEMERRDELTFAYFYAYISVNFGYRIPFNKGYEKINEIF